ncbi:MAG: bifunctional 4-hydroxy-2-oxoglutarate aldolase/2-dehydro-3-deoxy-phosphogluconate aldolase [Planctomycetia bacterium]
MAFDETMTRIATGKVVAIFRGDFGGMETDIVAAMADAGLTAVEVTLTSPDALAAIERVAKAFGSRMAVGAGTVLSTAEVDRCAAAGATFIVSPNRDLAVITHTKKLGLGSFPGCFTPSEIVEAVGAGADAAKLFPASVLGPGFVKAIRGPLPTVKIVPTGGVTPEAAKAYLEAGAWGVGAGSELVNKDVMAPGGLDRLRDRTAAYLAACRGQA